MMEDLKNKNAEDVVAESEEQVYYGVGSFLWEVAKVFVWALVIIAPIRVFLFQPFRVQGASMEPNFKNSDYLVINELGYKQTELDFFGNHLFTVASTKDLSRGEVLVFRYPRNPQQYFIKRIVGLPGEEVKVVAGKVMIVNSEHPEGFVLDESDYLPKGLSTSGNTDIKLNDQQYFVLGDNRQNSSDSRVWGPVPKDDVIGKVLIRAWPFSKMEIL